MYRYLSLFIILLLFYSCKDPSHYQNQEPITIILNKNPFEAADYEKDKNKNELYVAISAMISPQETFSLYRDLLEYIEQKSGFSIRLKQRKTYEEINKLLKEEKLDFAYVCSGAYVLGRNEFPVKLLAAPVINGRPYYQAYIIVNKNSNFETFEDLEGHTFAFTDPLSNTGYNYVITLLKKMGKNPDKYFKNTIFTYAHDNSIYSVAKGIVGGATIDGLVYEYIADNYPKRVANVKILKKSKWFGIPPFVYNPSVNPAMITKIKNILLTMHTDPSGKEILEKLNIDKFTEINSSIYNSIEMIN